MRNHQLIVWIAASAGFVLCGCQAPGPASSSDTLWAKAKQHKNLYSNFDAPRKIGSIENKGLQIPTVSPNGDQILYLRTDRRFLSPMTVLGSPDPRDTPKEGTLSVWLRPTKGAAPGRRISNQRWAHSATWSKSGKAIAYVVNEPPGSFIVHVNLDSGQQTVLGVPNTVNCLPRFDGDDHTLLFCAGESANGPFRVYRQRIDQAEPIALSPEGFDCLFPVTSDDSGRVLCARIEGSHLNWVKCGPDGVTKFAQRFGASERPLLLQTWAGISDPLSPDRKSFLCYDISKDLISVYRVAERLALHHRPGSMAACWLDNQIIALATMKVAFIVNTETGVSTMLPSGSWNPVIPCRYVPTERRLILLGKHRPGRFSIWEVNFKKQS